jgi:2-dehydro-3-deoxyphosphogluconate aldolase/(4S)-4-hydroxy-2-oxoglutarate aldolase
MAALVRGGIEQVEVTIDTPGALAAVAAAAEEGRTVGVGTVVDSEQVRASAAAGARFVVSPGLVTEVIETALELGLEPCPASSPQPRSLAATAAGARVMKLFPASCGGPSYLRALRGPFPTIPIIPTGGVRIEDVGPTSTQGATVIALGGELVGRTAPTSNSELEWITAQAVRATAAARDGALSGTGRAADAAFRPRDAGSRRRSRRDRAETSPGMQAYCDEHGVALRPHIKTHKLPQLAQLQLDAGAVGITCQKLGEAEVMADAGVEDILLSFPLVGEGEGRAARRARRSA